MRVDFGAIIRQKKPTLQGDGFPAPTTTKYNADDQHRLLYFTSLVHPEYYRQITPYLRCMTPANSQFLKRLI